MISIMSLTLPTTWVAWVPPPDNGILPPPGIGNGNGGSGNCANAESGKADVIKLSAANKIFVIV